MSSPFSHLRLLSSRRSPLLIHRAPYTRSTDPSKIAAARAAAAAKAEHKALRRRKALRFALTIGSAFSAGLLFKENVYNFSFGIGESMLPTFPAVGTMNVFSVHYRYGRDIKRGDIVCAIQPNQPWSYVGKRCIGLPGDYVVWSGKNECTVGGALNHGMRGNGSQEAIEAEREEPRMIRVPEGHVWLQGDNMGGSTDSRAYGPLPMALIQGKTIWTRDKDWNWTYVGGEHEKFVRRKGEMVGEEEEVG